MNVSFGTDSPGLSQTEL